MNVVLDTMRATALVAAVIGLTAGPAGAQCAGDCNSDDGVTLGEVMTCGQIFLDNADLSTCANADVNQDGDVWISEVVGAARSFLFGCPTPPPTPTPTPTNTPTPLPTNTPTPVPTDTPTSTPDPPTATPTPAASAECGNALLEEGETCSSCPADCDASGCSPSGQTASFDAFLSAGRDVTAVVVQFGYRTDTVQIPGSGTAAEARARITGLPSGGQSIINDQDYAVRIVKSRTEPLLEGRLFSAELDVCSDAAVPTVDDFDCVILSCSDAFSLPVPDCNCDVIAP